MVIPLIRLVRPLLTAGILVVALAACGRRGPPEPPPDPSVIAAQKEAEARKRQSGRVETVRGGPTSGVDEAQGPDVEDDPEEGVVPTPIPTPQPRRTNPRRGFVIPKEPFILDPLL